MKPPDDLFMGLDDAADASYWQLKNGVFKGLDPGERAWHSAGFRRGARAALRWSARLAELQPSLERLRAALEANE